MKYASRKRLFCFCFSSKKNVWESIGTKLQWGHESLHSSSIFSNVVIADRHLVQRSAVENDVLQSLCLDSVTSKKNYVGQLYCAVIFFFSFSGIRTKTLWWHFSPLGHLSVFPKAVVIIEYIILYCAVSLEMLHEMSNAGVAVCQVLILYSKCTPHPLLKLCPYIFFVMFLCPAKLNHLSG